MPLYSVVLAGGLSSRMGQDKAELRTGGRSLLERVLDLLEAMGSDRILVSGRVAGHESVPDLVPHAGPPAGLYSTLAFLRGEAGLDGSPLLVIPVDMPLLKVEVLARLLASSGEADAVHYENEVFPCVFRATEGLYGHLEELFREGTALGGKRSMKGLFAHLNGKAIPAGGFPADVFRNVNRPEDWEAISALLSQDASRRDRSDRS